MAEKAWLQELLWLWPRETQAVSVSSPRISVWTQSGAGSLRGPLPVTLSTSRPHVPKVPQPPQIPAAASQQLSRQPFKAEHAIVQCEEHQAYLGWIFCMGDSSP